MVALCVLAGVALALGVLVAAAPVTRRDCAESDELLAKRRDWACAGLAGGPTEWCGDSYRRAPDAHHDWPNQAVYMQEFLDALADAQAAGCADTAVALNVSTWLNASMANTSIGGGFMGTWRVFQVQYYDMPRKPGVRIEAPDTLGRKCWAFAYLRQYWRPKALPPRVSHYIAQSNAAIAQTMRLCEQVMANCFVNATYDPTRNGTCPFKIEQFHYLGFERENILRGLPVDYPFYD